MPWSFSEKPAGIVSIFTSFIPGPRLIDGTDLADMSYFLFSTKHDVEGGTTAVDAVPLETYISQVTDGSTVVLPPGLPGRYIKVLNDTITTLQIFPSPFNPLTGTSDTIASAGSSFQGASTSQAPGDIAEYICFAEGLWKQSSGAAGGAGPGGGIPDAPINGVTYGRLNGGWVPVLGLGGGTLTGPLILPAAAPTDPNQAITLSFVQNTVNNLAIDEGTY